MRYFLIACVALAVVVFGGIRAAPLVMDWWVDSSCPAGIADPDCYRSIRTMGHIWTKKGDLDRGGTWYLRGARTGDRESMFHLAWVYEEVVIDHYQEQARAFPARQREQVSFTDPDRETAGCEPRREGAFPQGGGRLVSQIGPGRLRAEHEQPRDAVLPSATRGGRTTGRRSAGI